MIELSRVDTAALVGLRSSWRTDPACSCGVTRMRESPAQNVPGF